MSFHWQAPNGPVAVVYVPYSHMDEDDAQLFYTTLNALIVYANERLELVEPSLLKEREGAPCMIYENGGRVADALWRNRQLVDDFVRDNPRGLSQAHLDCARPWRYALRDVFTVVRADENSMIVMNDTSLFAVGAMQDPADSHVHGIPCVQLLTLLPFKGGIVTSGMTIHLARQLDGDDVPFVALRARGLTTRTIIATADQLVAYGKCIPDGEGMLPPRLEDNIDRGFSSGLLR